MVHIDRQNQSEDRSFGLKPNIHVLRIYFLFTSNKTVCLQLFF